VAFAATLLSSFKELKGPDPKPKPLKFIIPKGWPKPSKDIFAKNKLTEEGFALGKKLFYDGNLSLDGQTSCGSCHQQFAAFSTFDHDLSHGVGDQFTERNAPALFNLAWMPALHWDGGVNHIEVQPLSPMTAHNEMGETLANILIKINSDSSYRRLFKNAFGNSTITSEKLLKALAQFTGSLVSSNSRFDQFKEGKLKFTAAEENGYQIYRTNCASCHPEPLFTDYSYRNTGMDLNRFNDVGRQRITGLSSDSLKFKVPSLRNVQYTAPYMHDGRFNSLDKVINHYRNLNKDLPGTDPALRNIGPIGEKEKQYLIYFLYTLTDTSFTKNKRFAANQPVRIKH
jgi:cytochrome c peroxidase